MITSSVFTQIKTKMQLILIKTGLDFNFAAPQLYFVRLLSQFHSKHAHS